jgi:ATP-dependent exoDNAse (exonuclease V) beta subunit
MSAPLSPDDLLTADSQARQQALERASFIVEAPAGAGKTELLTQRFLALLPTVQDPEEIIALTFTNKAAAEMRSRIMDSLALAARGERPGDELPHKQITFDLGRTVLALDAEREWGLMQHPGRLQITTLDALCGRLARQMPFLSRFGAQPTVSPDAQPLYRKAARNTLDMLENEGNGAEESAANENPNNHSPQALLSRVLAYFDNDARKLQSLLEAMLATRDQWLGHLHGQGNPGNNNGPSPEALAQLVEGELATIASALPAPLQEAMMTTARYAADMARQAGGLDNIAALLNWGSPLAADRDELPRWRGLGELLLTKTGTLRSRFDPALKLSEKDVKPLAEALKTTIAQLKDNPTAEALLARISQLPDPQPPTEDWQLVADFSRLLVLASAQLWLVFLEERQVDFTEVAQNALAALGSSDAPSELRERLDYRISHLLVDEFQDTSPTQVRLLEQLTSDWQLGDGRTLFLVGDPMQSIYRFRKADVGLFLKVRQRGIGGLRLTSLRLYRNNRSHPELVEWVNAVFPQVFAAEDDPRQGAVKFAPAAPTKASHPQARVEIHPIVDSGDDSDDDQTSPADQREARQMVALLRQARQDDPEGSIAVLVRAKSHLQPLVAELRQAGPELAYQAVEIEALDQRQAIQDLLALTRALHHRADRVNWLAILRAPWCGLVLADLHALAADDHRSTIWQLMQDDARINRLSADGQQRLAHVRSVLAEAYAHQGQHRPRRWVEGIWQALGGPRCLQDASEAQDVTAFFALLDSAEHKGSLDLDRLDEAMAKLFAAPDPKGGAIQLMTVHKSKGLEFDTVLLPGLHRTLRGNDRGLLLWEEVLLDDADGESQEHLLAAPLPRRKPAKGAPPSAYDYLQEFEKRRSAHEGQRVLYVAVTRARRQLHLLAKVKPSDKEGEVCKAPAKNTALAQLWPALGPQFEAAAEETLTAINAATARQGEATPAHESAQQTGNPMTAHGHFLHWLVRLTHPYQHPELGIPPGAIKEDAGNDDLSTLEEGHLLEAHVGTLVHRYLELIAKEELAHWLKRDIQQLLPNFRQWLSQHGHNDAAADAGANKVAHHLTTTLQSEMGRWLLSPHQDASSEFALSAVSKGSVHAQVVDRSFVDQGFRWVVDYKTAEPEAEDAATFLTTQVERYRAQLSGYADLMSKTQEPVRCALFFTGLGHLALL